MRDLRGIFVLILAILLCGLDVKASISDNYQYFSTDYSYCMHLRKAIITTRKIFKETDDEKLIRLIVGRKNELKQEFNDFNCYNLLKRRI